MQMPERGPAFDAAYPEILLGEIIDQQMPLCGLVLHHDDVRAIVPAPKPCSSPPTGRPKALELSQVGAVWKGVAPDAGPRQPTGGCLNAFAAGGDRLPPGGPPPLRPAPWRPAVASAYTPKRALYLALMASPWASTAPGSSRITLI